MAIVTEAYPGTSDYQPIPRDEEAALIQEALAANPELSDSEAPFALLTLEGDSPYARVARALEGQVFGEWFDNGEDQMTREYGPYEDVSKFFLLVDRSGSVPAGVVRIIHPSDKGLKSVNDLSTEKARTPDGKPVTDLTMAEVFDEFGIDEARTLDVATIAANPAYSKKESGSDLVLSSLMRALYHYAYLQGNDYDNLVAIIDEKPLGRLESVGSPIHTTPKIARPFEYLGAKGNTFIEIPLSEVETSVSAVSPVIFDYVFGEGALYGECQLSFLPQ